MAVREILKMGDPRLLRIAQPVERFDTRELRALVADMFDTMEAANGAGLAAPQLAEPLSYYHELDPTFYSVTSSTFIGQVYALFGLANIADGVEEGNDYPQLSAEYIVSSTPDLVFLADTKCCGESAATVGARAGCSVVVIDDDIASRWGPRIVEYVQAVSDALAKVPAEA